MVLTRFFDDNHFVLRLIEITVLESIVCVIRSIMIINVVGFLNVSLGI